MKYTITVNEYGIFWYKEGTNILHREDGPAIEWSNGSKSYFINGKLHRENGPAIEYSNGYKEYWINSKQLTEEEFNNRNKVFTKEQLKKMSLKELHGLVS